MKRQSSDTVSLVYAYGCGQPIAGLAQAEAEAELCAQMWDRLVAADRLAEDALRARAAQAEPAIAECQAQIQRITAAIAEERERAGALRAERRSAWRALNRAVADWGRAHPAVRDEIEAARKKQIVAIRQSSGLYWGNYNRVIESYDRSRKQCRTMGRRLQLADLERDEGCLTVQIQRTRSGLGKEAARRRAQLGLNQAQFWTPLGCTQSGGSRYESGRPIPKPVQLLLGAIYYDGRPLPHYSKARKA